MGELFEHVARGRVGRRDRVVQTGAEEILLQTDDPDACGPDREVPEIQPAGEEGLTLRVYIYIHTYIHYISTLYHTQHALFYHSTLRYSTLLSTQCAQHSVLHAQGLPATARFASFLLTPCFSLCLFVWFSPVYR